MKELVVEKLEATQNSQASDKEVCPITWLEENIYKIKGHARRYLASSPYELEEFIQTAYEVALSIEQHDEYVFEQTFWLNYKKSCRNMLYNKGDKRIQCVHEEYIEFGSQEKKATNISVLPNYIEEDNQEDKDVLVKKVLAVMTDKEREVWELLLDGWNLKEISRRLNKSKTAVIKLKTAGLNRSIACL